MGKVKSMKMEQEMDDMKLEKVLDEAADAINNKKAKAKKVVKKEKKVQAVGSEFDDFKKFVNATGTAIKKTEGGVYLKAEAWLYLAKIKDLTPSLDITPHRSVNGKLIWVDAVCRLYNKDGVEVSKSTMMASKEEAFLKDLDDYAVYGMAETRAITRAVRNVYGYVAKGAGFESTPAIEMGLEQDSRD